MEDYSAPTFSPWYSYRDQIREVVIEQGVTHIGRFAFFRCEQLRFVTIPNSVRTIGEFAFGQCRSLTSVNISSEVTTIREYTFSNCSCLTSIVIPDKVTAIGESAFSDCTNLVSVTIPNSVTAIGRSAFSNCTNLTSIVIPNKVTTIEKGTFEKCSRLTSVIIPNSVTTIRESAFMETGLPSVVIPPQVTTIEKRVFANCRALKDVYVRVSTPPQLGIENFTQGASSPTVHVPCGYWAAYGRAAEWQNCAIAHGPVVAHGTTGTCNWVVSGDCGNNHTLTITGGGSMGDFTATTVPWERYSTAIYKVVIKQGVANIGAYAFYGFSKLTSLEISSTVTAIGKAAFYNCGKLTSVNIPNSVTAIGELAFGSCALTSVDIPNSVKTIGGNAFARCTNLTSVAIGDEGGNPVATIGLEAFYQCTNLTSVAIGNSVKTIGESAFNDCPELTSVTISNSVTTIGKRAFGLCRALAWVDIPNSVTTIEESAFSGCNALTSVAIGNSVKTIGKNAFYGCNLTSVNIPNSVTTIGEVAFYRCKQLASVSIGNSVTFIEMEAFRDCPINYMHVEAAAPPSLGSGVFTGTPSGAMLRVPCGSKEAYAAAAQWKNFSPIIQGYVLTTRSNNASMGAAAPASMEICSRNSQTDITADPNYGYIFVGWSDGNTSTPRTVTITWDTTYTAVFALDTFSVTVEVAAASAGKGSVTGDGKYPYNTQATLEAKPNLGYHFVRWNDDNTGNPRTVTVTRDTTYTAVFALDTFPVTALVATLSTNMGIVTGGGDYGYDTQATLEAKPQPGYHFVRWNDNNTINPRTFTVTEAVTYTAEFAINIYTVNVYRNNDSWGAVSGDGDYAHGALATLGANPQPGYHFEQWSDGSRSTSRTFTVTRDTAYTAEFAINSYTVTVYRNNNSWGAVSGDGPYAHGTPATLTATPQPGYHFEQWSDGNTSNPRTETVTENKTYTAIFALATFSVTARVAAASAGMGSVTGDGKYPSNTQATLEAIPNPGYHFVKWNDDTTSNPRTFTVTEAVTYTAEFAINSYTVNVYRNN
ncbi:MAG: leucine-rich repeat protein, partial [Prevotellaceae bacterium]|nr:leucine-rich repeat protein [Prevotellaceae bacterium]